MDRRMKEAPPGQPEPVLGIGERARQRRLHRGERPQARDRVRAREGALEEAVPPNRVDELPLVPERLHVELEADVAPGDEFERLLERRQLGRDLPQLGQRALAHAAGRRAVADLHEVVRVREDERPIGEIEDVDLDEVDAVVDRGLERAERVLGRERGRAPVADLDDRPLASKQVHQALLITTTAASSLSSPPAKLRQSATTARASSLAESSPRLEMSASSRSVPYSSPSLRASITPSVYRTTADPEGSSARTSS